MNARNFGIYTGRLSKAPTVFTNADGSKKIVVNVASRDNFKTGGKYATQFMDFHAFVPAGTKNSVYDRLTKGTPVTVTYSLRNNRFTGADGNEIYGVEMRIENLDLGDTAPRAKKTTEEVATEA